MVTRLSLRLRVFLFFVAMALGALVAIGLGLAFGYRRHANPEVLPTFIQAGAIAGFLILGLMAWIWFLFDTNVAKPIDFLSGTLRARAHSDVTGEMDPAIARYLGDLAAAASAAARRLTETRSALAESVMRETQQLSDEKSRLETLLSDVPVGVLLCSGDHALAFYNTQAADLLAASAAPGLDRKLFDYLREGPVRHAHDRLIATGDADAATDLLCTTALGAKALAARMRLIPGARGLAPAYVLTMQDVTADLTAHARRETLVGEILDRVRRPAANLSALIAVFPKAEAAPDRLDAALCQEIAALSQAVTELARRRDEAGQEGWPLIQTRASDLADGLKARLEGEGAMLATTSADLLLRCNGFEIISLFDGIALHLREELNGSDMSMRIEEEVSGAMIRLCWQGKALGIAELDRWLAEPLDQAVPEISCRSVLAAHGTEIWPEPGAQGQQSLCLPIRQARRATTRPKPIVRNVVYDFDLLSRARSDKVADSPLQKP